MSDGTGSFLFFIQHDYLAALKGYGLIPIARLVPRRSLDEGEDDHDHQHECYQEVVQHLILILVYFGYEGEVWCDGAIGQDGVY